MIGYTLPEIRRLLISLVQACLPDPDSVWSGHAGAGDASTRPGNATAAPRLSIQLSAVLTQVRTLE